MMKPHGQALKDLRLKVTPKRLAILEVLSREFVYLSAEEIWGRVKERFAGIGLPTVYRNLDDLASGGIISRVLLPDRKQYYYLCDNLSHHHHFVCVSCRKVEDVHFCAEKELHREVTETLKGRVLSHILQINGLCGACSRNTDKAGRPGGKGI